eukprot:996164-Pyramimonas_sp.AAC.1
MFAYAEISRERERDGGNLTACTFLVVGARPDCSLHASMYFWEKASSHAASPSQPNNFKSIFEDRSRTRGSGRTGGEREREIGLGV